MKSTLNPNDYALTFGVGLSRFNGPLSAARKNFIAKSSSGKNKGIDQFNKAVLSAFTSLQNSLNAKGTGNAFVRTMKEEISSKIIKNIQDRMRLNYKHSYPKRLEDALLDQKSNEVGYDSTEDMYKFGIGHKQTLIGNTSIFLSHHPDTLGQPYKPPRSYGGITSWFQFHEYTGASSKRTFSSFGALRWINMPHPPYLHYRGGFSATPVFKTSDGEQFSEDRDILRNLPRTVSRFVIRNIKKEVSV